MIQKIYKAMFYLEDLREILRETTPDHRLDEGQKKKFKNILNNVKDTLDEEECQKIRYITDKIELRTREEDFINIDPIQVAGRLTPEARKALIAYGDGYSVCDYCFKPFRLDYIKKPPVQDFFSELSEFVGMDVARVVRGARNGFQIVSNALLEKGDIALVSSLAHYTLCLSIESIGAEWREIPLDENNIITKEKTAEKIEEVKNKSKKLPKLIAVSHFDYMFGNEHDVYGIGKVCEDYEIPFLYNGAYTVGVMPVDGKKIGADFVVGSGHKSMASPAPTGILATTDEFKDKVFAETKSKGDITGRQFGIKEMYLLGCTVMGAPLIAMMASFPKVKERVKNWEEEIKKSNFFLSEFLKIEGNKVSSEMPRKHTLTKVDTRDSFDKIAKKHKRRGYFLYEELSKRKITGIFPGSTREFKLNTYGLSWDQIKYLADAFKEIAEKYGIWVEDFG
ncbi:MAG: O-phospho-L-seryl-tRNA:Cys-tRNA synthase [Candidatus Methanolliviera sp. GoM_oil]|nr:MAG: O-phospho-L-seryl-tRNA:Cys-tRNA synthase [Candidatus Methanolliviera sp. GoM_oil]